MNEEMLTNYAKAFLQENFQIALSIPIQRNNRLRAAYGRFVYTNNKKPLRIEIAGLMFDYATEDVIYNVLRHECIHYALFTLKKPYHDGDAYFEAVLKQYDAASTNTLKVGKYIVYTCEDCQTQYETRVKQVAKTPDKYRTTCCQSPIMTRGERVYRGD
ncbi:MAG TPA: SprT-like domain-containing protein [Pseudogracilibacillus sp.]|nr:SprT-like domain-containing protein [Pseudogracilibacillus sp.]